MLKTIAVTIALTLASTGFASAATAWTTGAVNFRDGPGTNYYKLGSVQRCTRVEAGENQNGWYRISWNGNWGWVSGRYLTWDGSYCRGGYNQNSGGGYNKPSGGY